MISLAVLWKLQNKYVVAVWLNVMLVGIASKISKSIHTHTSVRITQDTTESRVSRLNVHTNQTLAHTTFQCHGTLESVVS